MEGEVVDDKQPAGPALLPAHPLELEAYSETDAEIRTAWAAVIPIDELRHVDAACDPGEYDAAVAADAAEHTDE